MKEVWKQIGDRHFEVSNLGRVRTLPRYVRCKSDGTLALKTGRILKDIDNGNGYRYVTISLHAVRKNYYVHRLVAETWIDNPQELSEVNHKDGDKTNNHLSNLEWVSLKGNREHAVKNDLIPHGEGSVHSKLTETQVIEILTIARENPNVNRTHLAKKYGICDPHMCAIIKGKEWRRVYNKFHEEAY